MTEDETKAEWRLFVGLEDTPAGAAVSSYIEELIEEARRQSGNPGMAMFPALTYLAERGHVEASKILDAMTPPGYMKYCNDTLAAAALHPDWEVADKLGVIRCTSENTAEDDPNKLLAWYRDKHGAA